MRSPCCTGIRSRVVLVLLMLLLTYSVYGQKTLRPVAKVLYGVDSLKCYTREQVREIVKRVGEGQFDKAESDLRLKEIEGLNNKLLIRQQTIQVLTENYRLSEQKVADRDTLIASQESLIRLKEEEIELRKQQTRKARGTGWKMGIGGVLLGILIKSLL